MKKAFLCVLCGEMLLNLFNTAYGDKSRGELKNNIPTPLNFLLSLLYSLHTKMVFCMKYRTDSISVDSVFS